MYPQPSPLVSALRLSIFHLIHLYEISIISNTRCLNTYYFMIDNKCITQHDLPSCPINSATGSSRKHSPHLHTHCYPIFQNVYRPIGDHPSRHEPLSARGSTGSRTYRTSEASVKQ